jgi:hypothetical protein
VPVHVIRNGTGAANLRKFRREGAFGNHEMTQRRFLTILSVLAALCLVVQGVTGIVELTLYLTPLFLLAALLLSGHYVAEDAIVRGWRARPRARRRRSIARAAVPEVRSLSSLLERSPLRRRGPPVSFPLAI